MAHSIERRYRGQVLVLMAIYMAIMIWLWPHALGASGKALKVALALSPVVPVAWVIALMAKRVMRSDELEQRLHLMALSTATALVGTACLVGGFLAAAKVWATDGSILIWVFPALCCTYGVTRMSLKYRYTGSLDWFC
ncbi:MAG: hypothetical protein ACTHJG_04175 [Rhodanobacteraceae bacterium]